MHRLSLCLLACAACGSPAQSITPHQVSPDAVRRTCAMEVSCLPNPPISSGGSCVSQFENGLATGLRLFFGPSAADLQRYVDCSVAAPDCMSALNCASGNHGPTWCAANPSGGCDGDVL